MLSRWHHHPVSQNINIKKRILVLNYEWPPLGGGASPVSYELAKRLSETGEYDIDVVTMHYKGLPKFEELNSNLRVYRVWSLRSKKELCHPWEQFTYLISGYFKARTLIKNQKFDICHAHFIIPTGVLSWVLKKQFGLEYVITSHGSDVPGFNTDRFKVLHKFTGPTLLAVAHGAHTIISPSNYLRELILKNISPTLTDKTVVIPNGIDTTKFIPQTKTKTIFSSGRLLQRKGFQYLIQAVSEEDLGWEVHIAGDGPMRAELEQMAKKSKTKVVLHGWLDNNGKEYKDLLEQASIYVLASEKENASIALLEAMSAACAVITTNISGCPETVGDSGVFVEVKNSSQIKTALKNIILNPNKLETMQKEMLKWVNKKFDWLIVTKEYRKYL
jgi:glycosyltransferase involved in cell wall biosynthesis